MWFRISVCAIFLVTLGVSSIFGSEQAAKEQDNPAQTQNSVRVPTGVMLGRFEHKVMPVYPNEAMMKGIEGEVWFNIEVGEAGKIVSVEATGGNPLLIAASKEALEKSRFYPYVVNGTPVRVETSLGFHFRLDKNGSSVSGRVDCITQGQPTRGESRR
jgi:TonB family protein